MIRPYPIKRFVRPSRAARRIYKERCQAQNTRAAAKRANESQRIVGFQRAS